MAIFMKRLAKCAIAAVAVLLLSTGARSETTERVVLMRSSDVALHTDPDTTIGSYYTVSYTLPDSLTAGRFGFAVLELFVDVAVKPRDEYVNVSPLLEVYALRQPLSGRFDPDVLEPSLRALRPVALGDGRRVVVDVTSIVRAHLEGKVENHGLIIGSLTGTREGDFTLKAGRFPDGAVGRLVLYERYRFARAEVKAP